MGNPSRLPSAAAICEMCFNAYGDIVGQDLPEALRWDLEALAEHFAGQNELPTTFIDQLVPWDVFARPSNEGHAAIADFLLCGAIFAAVSTNYDRLIENSAHALGAFMTGALNGDEANRCTAHRPLLKPHGCAYIDRRTTIWAPSQLEEGAVAQRIENTKNWMRANLREKDLLIVGFWSNWGYLNRIVEDALDGTAPASITLVDPDTTEALEEKAARLWEIAHSEGVTFHHQSEAGEVFLQELRVEFSRAWLQGMLRSAREAFTAETQIPAEAALLQVSGNDVEILYGRRRDAEGVPPDEPSRKHRPPAGEALGLFHLLLRHAGAVESDLGYTLGQRTIRIINGSNQLIAKLKGQFSNDAPSVRPTDIVACVGGVDTGQQPNFMRNGKPRDFMRPGSSSRWLDFTTARAELGI